jgi:dTDP-4-amino-4,6-dideoxygalactose transaminase
MDWETDRSCLMSKTPRNQFVPFALPDIGEEEIIEVVDALRSGWLSTGPKARQFENEFAEWLGGGLHAVAVNSATAGLHLAVEALGVGPGDQVIVPTHTFTATAEVVRYMGADPVIVDIKEDDYCIDPQLVERAVGPATKAVIPVHYAGLAADMGAISSLAQSQQLAVVEDAAHAFPTVWDGRLIGTLESACSVFSFYATKTLATGEGGMLVTRNAELAKRARVMRLHGIDRDAFDRYATKKPSWYYEVVAPGYKYNLTDVAAAIGLQQLRKAGRFHERRMELARRYDAAFASLPVMLPPRRGRCDHAWHLYVISLRPEAPITRDELIIRAHESGIGLSVHYVPLHRQPYWRDRYKLDPKDFPVSERLYHTSVSLPLYTRMTDADQDRVIDVISELISRG